MTKTKASCPASLSFIFKKCPSGDLLKAGSIGVGCTVDKEVTVETEKSIVDEIIFNGTPIDFPTVHSVVRSLATGPVRVSITSPLPLGCGFGISGASALATASALNKLLDLRKKKSELARIAHLAEIGNQTGLGSVATQVTGGFLLKNKAGLPAKAVKLPFVGEKLYAIIIGKLLTPSILRSKTKIQRVNAAADFCLRQLKNNKFLRLSDVLDISFDFVTSAGLLTDQKLANIISQVRRKKGSATMAILGKVVVTNIQPTFIKDYQVTELTITNNHL